MDSTSPKCPECGGDLTVTGLALWVARCAACGFETGGTASLLLPEDLRGIANDDDRPGVLFLDSAGADPLAVAKVLKTNLEITSTEALELVRTSPVRLAERPSARLWQLTNLEKAIGVAGGRGHIERVG